MTPRLRFTRNGMPIGRPIDWIPEGANDLHLRFNGGQGGAFAQFTRGGKPIGKPIPAPEGANDVGFDFELYSAGAPSIRRMYWTRDGERMKGGAQPAPEGADDGHLILPRGGGHITAAWWTRDGTPIGDIKFPFETLKPNDVHFGLLENFPWRPKQEPPEDIQLVWTRDGQRYGPAERPPIEANDLHLEFVAAGAEVVYTKDGKEMRRRKAPEGANDIGIDFERDGDSFRVWRVYWTRDGKPMPDSERDPDEAPMGCNDVHLILSPGGWITRAWWTRDRKPLPGGEFEVPPYVNDFHFGERRHMFGWVDDAEASGEGLWSTVLEALAAIRSELRTLSSRPVAGPKIVQNYSFGEEPGDRWSLERSDGRGREYLCPARVRVPVRTDGRSSMTVKHVGGAVSVRGVQILVNGVRVGALDSLQGHQRHELVVGLEPGDTVEFEAVGDGDALVWVR
ncbi:MAG: hypothetical protein AAF799_28925 [Myxococcota bacterium]